MDISVRRVVGRAILAAGVGALAIMLARSCEQRHHDVTIVVDPGPLGESVRAVRVDLIGASGAGGSAERRYREGEPRTPVRMRVGAPGAGAELSIEVEGDAGPRRVRRSIDAPAGSRVEVLLGVGADPGGATR